MCLASIELIAEARNRFQTKEIEIDDMAEVSEASTKGAWVQAWVWVPGNYGNGERV